MEDSPKVPVNAFIPHFLKIQALKKNIGFSEALIFGINFKLAELDEQEYPTNPLTAKIEKMSYRIQDLTEEIERYKNTIEVEASQEADSILNEVKQNGDNIN